MDHLAMLITIIIIRRNTKALSDICSISGAWDDYMHPQHTEQPKISEGPEKTRIGCSKRPQALNPKVAKDTSYRACML